MNINYLTGQTSLFDGAAYIDRRTSLPWIPDGLLADEDERTAITNDKRKIS